MDRKALARDYKNTPRPMGVYCVRNIVNGKAFLGTARDLPGYDPRDDLRALEALWLDRLQPYGERGYHTAPGSR
jgi:hypothetical protein